MPKSNDELDAAVSKFWQEVVLPGGMTTKWFLVVEGFGDDGGRWLDFVWSDDLKTWEVKGFLHEALDSQVAGQVAGQVADEIRDED